MLNIYKGKEREPHIYFIIKENCLYIGETKNIALKRWGQHLNKAGSFSKNLLKHNSYVFYKDCDIYFFSYDCAHVKGYTPRGYLKREIQHIEDMIHKLFNKSRINIKYTLISNTIRTAPKKGYNTILSHQIAIDIFQEFLDVERTLSIFDA